MVGIDGDIEIILLPGRDSILLEFLCRGSILLEFLCPGCGWSSSTLTHTEENVQECDYESSRQQRAENSDGNRAAAVLANNGLLRFFATNSDGCGHRHFHAIIFSLADLNIPDGNGNISGLHRNEKQANLTKPKRFCDLRSVPVDNIQKVHEHNAVKFVP